MDNPTAASTADRFFRHEAGRMVARLARLLGPRYFDLAEDAVQDAMCAALETWRFHGIPRAPEGWLMRAAQNRAIDLVRANRRLQNLLSKIALDPTAGRAGEPSKADLQSTAPHDDCLMLMFSSCNPRLATNAQLALILKALCGFSLDEIAAAFFVTPSAIEKRVTRAKACLKRSGSLFNLDNPREVVARLGTVLQALYLLFNEGYHSLRADAPVRDELCHEAIRLAQLLAADSATRVPATDALLAMMYFNLARLVGRVDDEGVFLALPQQDRTRWDQQLIALGFRYLDASATGGQLHRFHLEAAIAAEHCRAPSLAETDWRRILELYDLLDATAPSSIVGLNQAIARGQVEGPAVGLGELAKLGDTPVARTYPFFYAAVAGFSLALGEHQAAIDAFEHALAVARSPAEQCFYDRKLRQISRRLTSA
jgi:RNA polymerase sigma factor (sigma-70 family)